MGAQNYIPLSNVVRHPEENIKSSLYISPSKRKSFLKENNRDNEWFIQDYDSNYFSLNNYKATQLGITSLMLVSDRHSQNRKIQTIVNSCPRLKKLSLVGQSIDFNMKSTASYLSECSSLQQINLIKIGKEFRKYVMTKIPQLKKPDKDFFSFVSDSSKFEQINIEKLIIQDTDSFQERIDYLLKIQQLNLLQLYLRSCDKIKLFKLPQNFRELSKRIKKLAFLNNENKIIIEDTLQFVLLINQMTELQTLKLQFIYSNLSASDIKSLKTNIKEVLLTSINFNSATFSEFCQNNHRIRSATFKNCSFQQEDKTIDSITQLLYLNRLKLIQSQMSSSNINQLLLSVRPKLISLTLQNCSNLCDDSFITISSLRQLQQLTICKTLFHNKGIIYLRKLKKLKLLILSFFNIDSRNFIKLMVNFKYLPYYQLSNKQKFVQDHWNKTRTLQNVDSATRIWIRFYIQNDMMLYE